MARALAAETDSQKVLETLCELSMVRGRASGAAVAQLSGDNGVYVAVSGKAQALLDISFPLEGTMTGRVAREHRTLSLANPSESSPFFFTLLPALGVGPILLLPLLANQQLFGVLSITRDAGHPL
ncbi:GAF domain-containing protein, partial [Gemmatimonas sp.]|uniref:GAF domain-containing protein n=1 Tax=Gemmatimonas sp. TaxID=1962908 RepID=UPI00391F4B39